MKSKILIIFLLTFIMLFGQHAKYFRGISNGLHFIGNEILVEANNRTTISLRAVVSKFRNDSINYVLFDNLLSKDKIIAFIHQPYYYELGEIEEKIVLPYPLLTPGKYTLEYVSQDTSFNYDFVYLP